MATTDIKGVKTFTLSLRYGFAVYVVNKVPTTQVQKWLGHASLQTTSIYLNVSGLEERAWVEKLW